MNPLLTADDLEKFELAAKLSQLDSEPTIRDLGWALQTSVTEIRSYSRAIYALGKALVESVGHAQADEILARAEELSDTMTVGLVDRIAR